MKRVFSTVLVLIMMVTMFTGCGGGTTSVPDTSDPTPATSGGDTSTPAEESHEPITLNFSMTATLDEHHGACWVTFADYVHEHCPWITIEVHPSSTLYDDSTFVNAIMRGNVEMGVTAPGYLGEFVPEASIFGACYIFNGVDHMNRVLNGEIGQELYDQVAEETGIRILGTIYKGRRTINLREDKEITCRADLEGVLLRVPSGESWIQMGEALGVTPTAMALSEVYLALNTGTIDGQDNPLQATMNYGFGEVTKSITMTNHVIDINWPSISEEIWQSFDDETKQVFMDGFQIAYDECFEAYDGEEADLIAQFREMGLSVYDDVDVSTLQEEVWEYYWDHPEISGNWDRETYDAIQSAA